MTSEVLSGPETITKEGSINYIKVCGDGSFFQITKKRKTGQLMDFRRFQKIMAVMGSTTHIHKQN